jgi:hypothetical protein
LSSAAAQAEIVAQGQRLLAVRLLEVAPPLRGERRLRHQPELVVEHHSGGPRQEAGADRVQADAAADVKRHRESGGGELLGEDERRILAHEAAAFLAAGKEARDRRAQLPRLLDGGDRRPQLARRAGRQPARDLGQGRGVDVTEDEPVRAPGEILEQRVESGGLLPPQEQPDDATFGSAVEDDPQVPARQRQAGGGTEPGVEQGDRPRASGGDRKTRMVGRDRSHSRDSYFAHGNLPIRALMKNCKLNGTAGIRKAMILSRKGARPR